jgi:hypothetical protein
MLASASGSAFTERWTAGVTEPATWLKQGLMPAPLAGRIRLR